MNLDIVEHIARFIEPEHIVRFTLVCCDWYVIGQSLVKAFLRDQTESNIVWLIRYYTSRMRFPFSTDDDGDFIEPKHWNLIVSWFDVGMKIKSLRIFELREIIESKAFDTPLYMHTWIHRETLLNNGSGYLQKAVHMKTLGHYKVNYYDKRIYLEYLYRSFIAGNHDAFKLLVHRYKNHYTKLKRLEQMRQLTPAESKEITKRIIRALK